MLFPRRKCWLFLKKSLGVIIVASFFVSLLNLLCFDENCKKLSENETIALSSLSEVVLQANVDERNGQSSGILPSLNTPAMYPHKKELDVIKTMKLLQRTSLDFCPKEKYYLRNRTSLLGRETFGHDKFLSVGIPSIRRKTKSYLIKTLESLVGAINENERENITFVVFLADFDSNIKQKQLLEIKIKFEKYVTSGILQVIQAPSDYYEALQHLHRSLGDHMDRVLWRSKQALDYVYLMCYCSYISQYYLQIEDDVIASPQFLSKISNFIHSQKTEWISLNVALLGFIGKLYPVQDLQNLASYIRLFYNEMPVDWLEPRWKKYRGQDPGKTQVRAASLFQHIGLISSFRPKESQRPNTLKEKFFDQFDQKYSGLNPPAKISSDLTTVSGKPSDAYEKGDGSFHARFGSAGNKMYNIDFKKETKVKRIVVETGANFDERDIIVRGALEVNHSNDMSGRCLKYEKLGEFRFGRVDLWLKGRNVRCIRINIVYQGRWIYFREIDIWPT